MSDMSGLKFSTPPLIINQPIGAANPALLSVQATGRTSTDSSVYNVDGFKYEWYKDDVVIGSSNDRSYTTSAAGDYYVVVSNELGSATSNSCAVS
jgi:hypothetical protein